MFFFKNNVDSSLWPCDNFSQNWNLVCYSFRFPGEVSEKMRKNDFVGQTRKLPVVDFIQNGQEIEISILPAVQYSFSGQLKMESTSKHILFLRNLHLSSARNREKCQMQIISIHLFLTDGSNFSGSFQCLSSRWSL